MHPLLDAACHILMTSQDLQRRREATIDLFVCLGRREERMAFSCMACRRNVLERCVV